MFPLTDTVLIFFMEHMKKREKRRLEKNYGLSLSFSLYLCISISLSEIRGRINLAVWPIIL